MDDLLPCPFCGGKADERLVPGEWEGYQIKHIYCTNCGADRGNKKQWNKRVSNEG